MKRILFLILALAITSGCASYQYAHKVKLVSFSDDVKKGSSVGPIRGEDCTIQVLGYKLGGDPTLDKAFRNAMNQAGSMESAGFSNGNEGRGEKVRYVNNVNTKWEGFDAVIFGKRCLVVSGMGYK